MYVFANNANALSRRNEKAMTSKKKTANITYDRGLSKFKVHPKPFPLGTKILSDLMLIKAVNG